MARKDEPSTTQTSEASPFRSLLIVLALLALLFGAYYLVTRSNDIQDNAATEQTTGETADEAEPKDEESTAQTDDQQTDTSQNQVTETTVEETDDAYSYVAGQGESFTGVARRAVAALNSELSTAERVAAETKLSQDAGAKLLDVGQSIKLDKSTVEAAVKWAKGLSVEQKAAWQPYADLVAW